MLKNTINRIYFNKRSLSDEEKKKSRMYSIFEGCTARTILTLTGGAYLVGYAKYLGASDQISGIIAAIPVLAGTIMMIAPIIYEACESRKFIVSFFCLLGRLLLGTMLFIPFIVQQPNSRVLMLMIIFAVANLLLSFTYPAAQAWLSNVTPDFIRGRYFGRRESCVLAFVTIITLIIGHVLDVFEKKGQQNIGFTILFTIVCIFALLNFFSLSFMKEEPIQISKRKLKISDTFVMSFQNKDFRKIIILLAIWNAGYQMAMPFTSVYMVSGLKLGFAFITFASAIGSLTSILVVPFWGRLADKKSWTYLFKIMVFIQIACFLIWLMSSGKNYLCTIPLAQIFSGAAIAGVNISVFNLQCLRSPSENKTVYLGVSSAIGGLCGFLGALSGAFIVHKFVSSGLYGMKAVFVVSAIALLFCFIYLNKIQNN